MVLSIRFLVVYFDEELSIRYDATEDMASPSAYILYVHV